MLDPRPSWTSSSAADRVLFPARVVGDSLGCPYRAVVRWQPLGAVCADAGSVAGVQGFLDCGEYRSAA
jgi:hypothetical protein